MATSNAPTGLDLSSCTFSPDGGKTTTTGADLVTLQNSQQTAITAAASDATDAKTTAATAASDATDAKTSVADLTAKAVTTDQGNVANGYAALDNTGCINTPGNWITIGENGQSSNVQMTDGASGAGTFPILISGWNDPSNNTANLAVNLNHVGNRTPSGTIKGGFCPDGPNVFALGRADNYWTDVFIQNAPTVISDSKDKTVTGSFDDLTFAQAQTLSDAVYGVAMKLFQLNASIAEKGAANARYHVGLIAQDLQAAITSAGLDPSKYAMWTETPMYKRVATDSGTKDSKGNVIYTYTTEPVYEADGKTQVMQQMLRYEQVLCAIVAACKKRINALVSEMSALTTRVAALEAKASS